MGNANRNQFFSPLPWAQVHVRSKQNRSDQSNQQPESSSNTERSSARRSGRCDLSKGAGGSFLGRSHRERRRYSSLGGFNGRRRGGGRGLGGAFAGGRGRTGCSPVGYVAGVCGFGEGSVGHVGPAAVDDVGLLGAELVGVNHIGVGVERAPEGFGDVGVVL